MENQLPFNGTLFRQSDDHDVPLLIFSPGLGQPGSAGYDYCQAAADNGYAAYAFDYPHETWSQDMTPMTLFSQEEDLNRVIDFFEAQGYHQIFLWGSSQGGAVSTMAAADRDDIQGIIPMYPAFVIPDMMRERFPDHKIPETFSMFGMTLGHDYAQTMIDYDFVKTVTSYQGPVLIIHGTSDGVAPITYSERAVKKYPHAQLLKLPGAGHGFFGASEQHAVAATMSFVKDNSN